jgi:hypothetical protein
LVLRKDILLLPRQTKYLFFLVIRNKCLSKERDITGSQDEPVRTSILSFLLLLSRQTGEKCVPQYNRHGSNMVKIKCKLPQLFGKIKQKRKKTRKFIRLSGDS